VASTALITGVAGQDGWYLSEFLRDLGYEVHGIDRNPAALGRLSMQVRAREDWEMLTLHPPLDVTDTKAMRELVSKVRPDELYNLAAQSRVDRSYQEPNDTFAGIVNGTHNVLEAVRVSGLPCRIFQASSSEMFGSADAPQREDTQFQPLSPYATAKMLAHQWALRYRETYGLYVCAGIMFNHESPRRSTDFVTRRITRGVARIRARECDKLVLGNLTSRRDWGHARDYVRAMRLMLQQPEPADYVVATGVSSSVREFAELAFALAGMRSEDYVVSDDPGRLRPDDPRNLCGDASRIQALGWKPETDLTQLVEEMLAADLQSCGADAASFASSQTSSTSVGVSGSPSA
jgi:GDPmannose 4,6-dehydratase